MNGELVEAARTAKRPRGNYTQTGRWLEVAEVLREREWSWGEIYDWLKERGEPVQRNRHTFIASMSRRHRIWRESQGRKR